MVRDIQAAARASTENLHQAIRYALELPPVSLTMVRKAGEAICTGLYGVYFKKAPERGASLDSMLGSLRAAALVPRRIETVLRVVQYYGNFGSHFDPDHERLDARFVEPCLAALSYATAWFFSILQEAAHDDGDLRAVLAGFPTPSPDRWGNLIPPSRYGGHDDRGPRVFVKGIPGVPAQVALPWDASFGDLTDFVYSLAHELIEPYTYGTMWRLKAPDSRVVLRHAREITRAGPGDAVKDDRNLEEMGIPQNAVLVFELLDPEKPASPRSGLATGGKT